MKIVAAKKILKANDQLAEENRRRFDAAGVYCVNLVGSPGCGKTTLLEALFSELKGRLRPAVIEGDIAGSIDAERIDALGVPVVQINTEGACHLDANMIANLVCTAGYLLGEHLRIVVLSTSEGDDKIAKYPAIFQGSQALVITKIDLLPHTNFRPERVISDMRRVAPSAEVFQVAALKGDGIALLAQWLERAVGHS
jgi:hydrogenase nickel incorporation protein HypB